MHQKNMLHHLALKIIYKKTKSQKVVLDRRHWCLQWLVLVLTLDQKSLEDHPEMDTAWKTRSDQNTMVVNCDGQTERGVWHGQRLNLQHRGDSDGDHWCPNPLRDKEVAIKCSFHQCYVCNCSLMLKRQHELDLSEHSFHDKSYLLHLKTYILYIYTSWKYTVLG